MILVNRNFGNPALSQAIGDMFKPSSNDDIAIDCVNHTNALATSSSLVSTLNNNFRIGTFVPIQDTSNRLDALVKLKERFLKTQNLFIVTEHFLKVLDKVYTKIWNESFTETAIYTPSNLVTIFNGFATDNSLNENSKIETYKTSVTNFMLFKKFVDRAITAGILLEEDRLDYQDQVSLKELSKTNLSTQVDLDNKLITFTCGEPVDIAPDINTQEGSYLYGKKLYLMMTPYLTNESVIKGYEELWTTSETNKPGFSITEEPFYNTLGIVNTAASGGNGPSLDYFTPVHRPIAFFKPKTPESKFGRSLPLATHFIWRIGTPEQKEMALLEGTEVPEIIFDHLDRISHIDSFVLKIKFNKLQF